MVLVDVENCFFWCCFSYGQGIGGNALAFFLESVICFYKNRRVAYCYQMHPIQVAEYRKQKW